MILNFASPSIFNFQQEMEIWEKKNKCYADIESGLWGEKCKTSMVAKENCALQCLSPVCYELIYESDPLEEGEKDTVRSQEYKYCMHKYNSYYLVFFMLLQI
nr:Protein OS-9 like [Ipomoea batatas]